MDVFAAPDDTLWVTAGWGGVLHIDRDGKSPGQVGRTTFAPGGFSLPMSVALTPNGNLLVADIALPYAQEVAPSGAPTRLLGSGSVFADLRLDRARYAWSDAIIAGVWRPIPGLQGDARSTLHAFARQGEGAWQPLLVEHLSGRDYKIATPKFEGKSVVRLAWGTGEVSADHPTRADFNIEISKTISPADDAKMRDIVAR